MINRYKIWQPLYLGLSAAIGLFGGFKLAERSGYSNNSKVSHSKYGATQEIMDLLRYKYVDSLPMDSLEAETIDRLLEKLDPHTVYLPESEVQMANEELEGQFSGIGVEYFLINDTMNLAYIMPGGPSDKAGLLRGDQVLKINDQLVSGAKLETSELRRLVRGAKGSKINVHILRKGQTLVKQVQRNFILVPSVDVKTMLSNDIGYIHIARFSDRTYGEFMDAMNDLQKQGLKKLILDLRGNGGGLMEQATFIADELLPDGLLIVKTKGTNLKTKEVVSEKPGLFETEPLAVLINAESASASEVLAGALQDNDRGMIVGHRSYGKGLVQEQYNLSNGGALRITVGRYYTPTGRSIQKPYHGDKSLYRKEIYLRDSLPAGGTDSTQKFITRKKRILYGGGGISPDISVALDSLGSQERISGFDWLNVTAYHLITEGDTTLKRYTSLNDFINTYQVPAVAWKLIEEQQRQDSSFAATAKRYSQAQTAQLLKTAVARQLWRAPGEFENNKSNDLVLKQAVEYLKNIKK